MSTISTGPLALRAEIECSDMSGFDVRATDIRIEGLSTPCLLLSAARMQRNIARLKSHLRALGTPLRPHLKTSKSVEIARLLMPTPAGPATVSTIKEAEQFAAAGVRDILYAVGIAPMKLPRVVALRKAGTDLSIVLDSLEQAKAVTAACGDAKERIPVLIEIDSDGHRAGIRPGDPLLQRWLHAHGTLCAGPQRCHRGARRCVCIL